MKATFSDLAYQLRPATASDYDALIDLWRTSGSHIEPAGRESREAFSRQLGMYPGTYLVADLGGQVIGVVLGTHDGRKGWINRLAVHPEYRRHGVAAALVTAADADLRRSGMSIVTALVEADNPASAGLFRKLGYHTLPVYYFRKEHPGNG